MRDQLGLDVTEIKPVGLESSAGSTPLRLRVQGGPEQFVFAKLCTKGHVRADRWYKLGRAILYGALEDEALFQTVRRLAEYEDYALHLVREAGARTARLYGIVEITPEREYLVVTEFFKDAVEIGQAEVDDAVIDQGLAMIRQAAQTHGEQLLAAPSARHCRYRRARLPRPDAGADGPQPASREAEPLSPVEADAG